MPDTPRAVWGDCVCITILATFSEVFPCWTSYAPAKPCQNTEVHFKPFFAIIVRVLDHWTAPVPVLMGTSPPFNELPGSPLSTACSRVNSTGQRSQDHRLHNASDCWLLILMLVLWGGVGLYVCVCKFAFVWLCVYVSICACDTSASVHACVSVLVFVCASADVCMCAKKEKPDWLDHRSRWNLMDCRLPKLLLMGIWRPVFEGGNSISSPCSPELFG